MTRPEHVKVMKNDKAEVDAICAFGQPRRKTDAVAECPIEGVAG